MGSNKFTQKLNSEKKKIVASSSSDRPNVELKELLAENGTAEITAKAKAEGRFISLPPSSFVRDTDQPRKTFEQAAIDDLRLSIEAKGQLQPIYVGLRQEDGTYPIYAGERRWRAISESSLVHTVDAIVCERRLDALEKLLVQIAENKDRESVPPLEHAQSLARVVDLCKSMGHDQSYAAKLLNISKSYMSKQLQILKAPEPIKELCEKGEVTDSEIIYVLSQSYELAPEQVQEVIEKWRGGDISNLREAGRQLLNELNRNESAAQEQNAKEQGAESPAPVVNLSPSVATGAEKKPRRVTAKGVRLESENSGFSLILDVGGKQVTYSVDTEVIVALKSELAKFWS